MDSLDHHGWNGEAAGGFAGSAVERPSIPGAVHLAIVDQSRLRRDCLKLALAMQPRRWRVTDVATALDLVRLVRQGESFAVILLGAATCAQIDLDDLALFAAATPNSPILVAAECEDARARACDPSRRRAGFSADEPQPQGACRGARTGSGGRQLCAFGAERESGRRRRARLRTAPPWSELTRRQRDVLGLISEGKSNKLIADALNMSDSTVKAHVKQIIKRLQVTNRTQAALLATSGSRPASLPAPQPSRGRGIVTV